MNFISELFIRVSCSRLRSFVHHVVVDVRFSLQEKLFVLTIFSGFIGLCRASIIAWSSTWNFWMKNWFDLELRYQSIQVSHWQKTVKLHALRRSTLHKQTNFPPSCNYLTIQFVNIIYFSSPSLSIVSPLCCL